MKKNKPLLFFVAMLISLSGSLLLSACIPASLSDQPENTPETMVTHTEKLSQNPIPTETTTTTAEPSSTPIEVLIPTNTPAPTPKYIDGEVLFEEDFEDRYISGWTFKMPNVGSDYSRNAIWKIEEEPDGNNAIITNDYRIRAWFGRDDWENYRMRFDFKVKDYGTTSEDGFEIRVRSTEKSCSIYNVNFIRQGNRVPLNEWHTITFEVFGHKISGFYDDEPMYSTSNTDCQFGSINLVMTEGAVAYFDNFQVIELISP